MIDFEYQLTKSKRKSICICVKPDASIIVRAPLKMEQQEIEKFIEAKKDWIIKTVSKMKATVNQTVEYSSKILFLGEELTLTAAEVTQPKLEQNRLLIPINLTTEQIKNCIHNFYKSQAKLYLPKRTAELSKLSELRCSSIQINSAKTHWGSCTADRIHLSYFLMAADEKTIDYVIIHELAHTIYHNHSNNFWQLTCALCPKYKTYRTKLKEYSLRVAALH